MVIFTSKSNEKHSYSDEYTEREKMKREKNEKKHLSSPMVPKRCASLLLQEIHGHLLSDHKESFI